MGGVSLMSYKIAIVVGSLRRDSINRTLANALEKLGRADFSFFQVRLDDLPHHNQDNESNPAEPVKRLKGEIAASQGVLFVTAENNWSIPRISKKAFDVASRPYGQSAWAGKPAGVIGASGGAPGASMAQQRLRNVPAYLDLPTLGTRADS